MISRRSRGTLALSALAGALGCLPGDERPPPASLYVDVQPNEATADGFTTDDGWLIEFDRFVTAVGDIELDDGDGENTCNSYAESNYDRLFDFAVAEPSKVGLAHALGNCSAEFNIGSPGADAILGGGVTASDRDAMRVESLDPFVTEAERTALLVRGRAERDGVTKDFVWSFRQNYEIQRCRAAAGDGYASILEMKGEEEHHLTIEIRAEELFREAPNDDAPITFDRFAASDANGDGAISIEELSEVAIVLEDILEDIVDELPDEEAARFDPSVLGEATLGMQLYMVQAPRVARFLGAGECEVERRNWRGGF